MMRVSHDSQPMLINRIIIVFAFHIEIVPGCAILTHLCSTVHRQQLILLLATAIGQQRVLVLSDHHIFFNEHDDEPVRNYCLQPKRSMPVMGIVHYYRRSTSRRHHCHKQISTNGQWLFVVIDLETHHAYLGITSYLLGTPTQYTKNIVQNLSP